MPPRCFSQIKGFGEYGFPESHAASFALLVYVSSWLKCHYPEVFACALLNSQPMGFYAPAQIVRDAREHGVIVLAVDVSASAWDSTLEPPPDKPAIRPKHGFAIRLGLRQVDGMGEVEASRIAVSRVPGHGAQPVPAFAALPEFMGQTSVKRGTLDKLAAADAFRSLGLDRRQALWESQALTSAKPLPLFAWAETNEAGKEPPVALEPMPLSEHVVADYQTLRLSLKAHPMSFLRGHLDAFPRRRVLPAAALAGAKNGARVSVAGVVLVRQRPGSAKGVVFMTLEDETGVANAVVWPKTLERYRRVVMGARLILIHGRIQRHENIIHIVSEVLEDRSDWLSLLADGGSLYEVADRAGGRGSSSQSQGRRAGAQADPRGVAPRSGPMHPRAERIVPKSRDFH